MQDLQSTFPFFASVGTDEVEVAPVGRDFGGEVRGAVELFAIEELVLGQAMNGFDVALPGITLGRNEAMIRAQGADGRGQRCSLIWPKGSQSRAAGPNAADPQTSLNTLRSSFLRAALNTRSHLEAHHVPSSFSYPQRCYWQARAISLESA